MFRLMFLRVLVPTHSGCPAYRTTKQMLLSLNNSELLHKHEGLTVHRKQNISADS